MYFVIIDLQQLYTRLCNSLEGRPIDLYRWIKAQQFVPSEDGWLGSAESMNSLSCSEILFSERRAVTFQQPSIFPALAN